MILKDLLKGKEVDFVIDYLGPLTDFDKKAGGTYEAHEAKLRTTSNGEVYDTRFFPKFADTVQQGDMVQGKLNNAGYPDFRKVESGEHRSNTVQVKQEREMAVAKDNRSFHDIHVGLRGLMQAHITAGMKNVDALDAALEADAMVMKTAQTLFDLQS